MEAWSLVGCSLVEVGHSFVVVAYKFLVGACRSPVKACSPLEEACKLLVVACSFLVVVCSFLGLACSYLEVVGSCLVACTVFRRTGPAEDYSSEVVGHSCFHAVMAFGILLACCNQWVVGFEELGSRQVGTCWVYSLLAAGSH